MLTHICGQCTQLFTSETDYLRHKCPVAHLESPPKSAKLSEKNILAAVLAVRQAKKHV